MFVKSKSGSTSEPRNAMKEVEHDFYKKESNEASVLWKYANTLDMLLANYYWACGHRSGLLPAALQRLDIFYRRC